MPPNCLLGGLRERNPTIKNQPVDQALVLNRFNFFYIKWQSLSMLLFDRLYQKVTNNSCTGSKQQGGDFCCGQVQNVEGRRSQARCCRERSASQATPAMATIRDVARKARVSVGTVSHVFSGTIAVSPELRSRVMDAAKDLNYNPSHIARSLSVKRTDTLGLVITDITNPFFAQMIRGAEDSALQEEYLLITINTNEQLDRERQVLSVLRSRRVDGILLVVAPNGGDASHIRTTLDAGVPIVCIDRVPSGIALDSVAVDNVKGSQTCVRHLIERGHRRIAIITGSLSLENAKGRLQGYELALREAGIKPNPELILKGDFREATGYRLGKELLLRPERPTAVFLSNGVMTMGFLRALYETGRSCPGDIAFATFDDPQPHTIFRPQITAVAQPAYEIGAAAAELLIQRVRGKLKTAKRIAIRLEPELKIRESSAFVPREPLAQSRLIPTDEQSGGRGSERVRHSD